MERQQWYFALRLRFPLPAQPSSFPPQQRDAVSALDYVLPYALRQRLIAGDAVDQGSNFAQDRPTHGGSNFGRYVTISDTRRVLSRSTARPSVSRLVGSTQCTSSKIIRIGLERDSATSCAVTASSVISPTLLGSKFQYGIASIVRQRQHYGKQCGVLDRGRGLRGHSIELVELRLRGVIVREPSGALLLTNDWASCSCKTPMICPSVNRVSFMSIPSG